MCETTILPMLSHRESAEKIVLSHIPFGGTVGQKSTQTYNSFWEVWRDEVVHMEVICHGLRPGKAQVGSELNLIFLLNPIFESRLFSDERVRQADT